MIKKRVWATTTTILLVLLIFLLSQMKYSKLQIVEMKCRFGEVKPCELDLDINNHKLISVVENSLRKQNFQDVKLELPENPNIQKVVHYVWCGIDYNGTFAFKNYMAIKSIILFLQPDKIIFYCNEPPKQNDYEAWFAALVDEAPFLEIQSSMFDCHESEGQQFIYTRADGMYLGEDTIITDASEHFWKFTSNRNTFNVLHKNSYTVIPETNNLKIISSYECLSIDHKNIQGHLALPVVEYLPQCIHVPGNLFPKDFWGKTDNLSKKLNYIMYDQYETPAPIKTDGLVPNIAHMYWTGGEQMNFLFYLSCLSLLYVVKVEHLYIHGDNPLWGKYWKQLQLHPNVMYIKRESFNKVYGSEVHGLASKSDIFRAYTIHKYGGIWSDIDVIWTQPLPESIRCYDAVAGLDWAHFFKEFPDYINLGVAIGKKKSKFWQMYLEAMKGYQNDKVFYHGILKPYKIYERHPDTLLLRPELQVMCFENNCYPLSGVNYQKMNWKNETYAFHFTSPDPPEFNNRESLLSSNSIFADIGKYVLNSTGIL